MNEINRGISKGSHFKYIKKSNFLKKKLLISKKSFKLIIRIYFIRHLKKHLNIKKNNISNFFAVKELFNSTFFNNNNNNKKVTISKHLFRIVANKSVIFWNLDKNLVFDKLEQNKNLMCFIFKIKLFLSTKKYIFNSLGLCIHVCILGMRFIRQVRCSLVGKILPKMFLLYWFT